MPIRIPIIADVVDAIRGARNLGESFDDVADALEDVEHDARAATRPVEEVGRAATDTTRDADQLERSFRDAFDTVRREAHTAGADVGDSMHRGTREASEGVQELSNEASSTSAEVAASFDGSAESIAGGFQELAANAFAGFGPAGAAAGVAVAAGIGLAISALQAAADEANELTEAAAEWAQEFGSADAAGKVEALASRFDEFATAVQRATSWYDVLLDKDLSRPETNIENLSAAAKVGAINAKDFYDAFNDTNAHRRLESLQEQLTASKTVLDDLKKTAAQSFTDLPDDIDENIEAVTEFNAALQDEINTTRAAVEIEKAIAQAKGQTVAEYRRAQKAAEDQAAADEDAKAKKEAYIDTLQASADSVSVYADILDTKTEQMKAAAQKHADDTVEATGEAADSWEDYATSVTVTTDDLIAEWNRQADEAAAFQTNLAEIAAAGGQALADELRAKGPEVAGAVAATIAVADPTTQKAVIEAHGRAAGEGLTTAMASGVTSQKPALQSAVDTVTSQITTPWMPVKLVPDTKDLDRELAKPRAVNVTPWFSGSGFRTV